MIIFKNNGVIDIKAIKTFGVSVKKEGSIGFFGTGLKYAIAILTREGCTIEIIAGGKSYKFKSKKVKVTGEDFDIITMNGKELGFTTELGKTWKTWQAFRELYCNCTDEGGEIYQSNNVPECKYNETVIAVSGNVFEEVFRDIELYILQDKPFYQNDFIEIRNKSTSRCFYKGVVVKEDMGSCRYTYNIKNKIELTEDRTAKYSFEVKREIVRGIVTLKDKRLIENIVCADDLFYEGKLDYDCYQTPSQEFLDVCKNLAESQNVRANKCAINYALKYIHANTDPKEFELSKLQRSMYEKSCELLGLAGYNVLEFPVKFVESLGSGVYAKADNGTMYLSKSCFDEGTKTVAHALLEEMFHLKYDLRDETREFQTFLFKQVMTLIERLNQEPF